MNSVKSYLTCDSRPNTDQKERTVKLISRGTQCDGDSKITPLAKVHRSDLYFVSVTLFPDCLVTVANVALPAFIAFATSQF